MTKKEMMNSIPKGGREKTAIKLADLSRFPLNNFPVGTPLVMFQTILRKIAVRIITTRIE